MYQWWADRAISHIFRIWRSNQNSAGDGVNVLRGYGISMQNVAFCTALGEIHSFCSEIDKNAPKWLFFRKQYI